MEQCFAREPTREDAARRAENAYLRRPERFFFLRGEFGGGPLRLGFGLSPPDEVFPLPLPFALAPAATFCRSALEPAPLPFPLPPPEPPPPPEPEPPVAPVSASFSWAKGEGAGLPSACTGGRIGRRFGE